MAVVNVPSPEINLIERVTVGYLSPTQSGGRVGMVTWNHAQGATAGDATSVQRLQKLPAGKILLVRCAVIFSAFGSSRVLDVGYEAHTTTAGAAVSAAAEGIYADIDVSAAGTKDTPLALPFDSADGVVLFSTVAGGTIPTTATIKGFAQFIY